MNVLLYSKYRSGFKETENDNQWSKDQEVARHWYNETDFVFNNTNTKGKVLQLPSSISRTSCSGTSLVFIICRNISLGMKPVFPVSKFLKVKVYGPENCWSLKEWIIVLFFYPNESTRFASVGCSLLLMETKVIYSLKDREKYVLSTLTSPTNLLI